MSSKVLFIFEGPKLEKAITDNLTKFFVNENTIITCAYCTTIYKMYSEISLDEDLDTFNLVKDIETNKDKLKDFKRSDFAQIYMFFDYDGHATNACDKKINELLNFFNEETEKGKLYISYPMVEALKHIENLDTFEELKVPCKENIDYKKIVRQKGLESLKHIIKYDMQKWKELIDVHLKKMNKIVNNSYVFPNDVIDQLVVFNNQMKKHINLDQTVAVLSAFPVFLHDYYGNEGIKKRLE
jgi:hemerythrin-like domain-containing protein